MASVGGGEGSLRLEFCCRCVGCRGAAKSTENLEEIFCLDWGHLTEGCLEGNIGLQLKSYKDGDEDDAMGKKKERRKKKEEPGSW